jgi:hypothetical protein
MKIKIRIKIKIKSKSKRGFGGNREEAVRLVSPAGRV